MLRIFKHTSFSWNVKRCVENITLMDTNELHLKAWINGETSELKDTGRKDSFFPLFNNGIGTEQ